MNRLYSRLLLASVIAVFSPSATAEGTIIGKVNISPKKTRRAFNPRYQLAREKNPGELPPPVAVVYIEDSASTGTSSETKNPVQMGQENLQFTPGLLVIQKGTSVEFPNFDDEYHNVLSYSKAKVLDLGRYRKNEKPPSVVFDQAGVVELSCEIHEHMQATVLVLETPFFSKSDADGNFRLEGVPAGNHTLKAWLNRRKVWEKPVTVRDGETVEVNFAGDS